MENFHGGRLVTPPPGGVLAFCTTTCPEPVLAGPETSHFSELILFIAAGTVLKFLNLKGAPSVGGRVKCNKVRLTSVFLFSFVLRQN